MVQNVERQLHDVKNTEIFVALTLIWLLLYKVLLIIFLIPQQNILHIYRISYWGKYKIKIINLGFISIWLYSFVIELVLTSCWCVQKNKSNEMNIFYLTYKKKIKRIGTSSYCAAIISQLLLLLQSKDESVCRL